MGAFFDHFGFRPTSGGLSLGAERALEPVCLVVDSRFFILAPCCFPALPVPRGPVVTDCSRCRFWGCMALLAQLAAAIGGRGSGWRLIRS